MCSAEGPSKSDDDEAPSTSDNVAAIKAHPLFPVLELLQRKCDLATTDLSPETFSMDDVTDLLATLKKKHATNCVRTGNADVDSLVEQAIISLRIHLLELQKVNHLCDEFKRRYLDAIQKTVGRGETPESDSDSADDEGEQPAGSRCHSARLQHADVNAVNSDDESVRPTKCCADSAQIRKRTSRATVSVSPDALPHTEPKRDARAKTKAPSSDDSDCDTNADYSVSRLLQ